MTKKRSIEEEINEFIQIWDCKQIIKFFEDIYPLFELYDVDAKDDWVKDIVGEDDTRNVRIIRTVYLISKIAHNHSGKLAVMNITHRDLWKRLDEYKNER